MVVPFLKDEWKWVDSDRCWCNNGRAGREHLFREFRGWKEEPPRCGKRWGESPRTTRDKDRMKKKAGIPKSRKVFGYDIRKAKARPSNTAIKGLSGNEAFH